MPKYLLSFLIAFFLLPVISKAQGIFQIHVQYSNPGVNNNLDVIAQVGIPSQPAFRISNSSRVSNDTLYLVACYYSGMAAAAIKLTDTIFIGSPPSGITTLHFKIFTSLSTSQCTQIGSAIKIQPFIISGPTGIKSFSDVAVLNFYPNPAEDYLSINNQGVRNIILRELTMKIIQNHNYKNGEAIQLDVRSLKGGIYLLEIISKDGKTQTQKLLKN